MADDDFDNAYGDGGGESSIISTRGLEAFGRKVTTTASHLIGPLSGSDPTASSSYQAAMGDVHKQLLRRPTMQRGILTMARTTPTDLVRSKLSRNEIKHRALAYVPDDLLASIPDEDTNSYSLFQGFQASYPEFSKEAEADEDGKGHRRRMSRGRKMLMLEETMAAPNSPQLIQKLRKERESMMHELEMLGIRKNMASSEIRDIDNKIANLSGMRRIVVERLAGLEQEEALLEHDILDVENRLEEAEQLVGAQQGSGMHTPTRTDDDLQADDDGGFMSQSIYMKLPSSMSAHSTPSRPGSSRRTTARRQSVRRRAAPVLHEHFEPGTAIREMRAHTDTVTALDFDAPFGTLVSSAMDDSVRVWDLNSGRCIGALEGHAASVRALQIEDNILATGSADATIRLWDLSKARYDPPRGSDDEEDEEAGETAKGTGIRDDNPLEPPDDSMSECDLFTLRSHVGEITALHFRGDVLVSGSADKTLRQWDLEKGRCVQTLDVMWAAAQANAPSTHQANAAGAVSASAAGAGGKAWRPTGRAVSGTMAASAAADASVDFVGALQVFEAALACGTADGMVRLWDLRSGQVHRSLVGHTGPVTCLQFDDVHLVTGSLDRSIRIWDLRTGSIYDAYAYENPVTSMMFDARRIVAAAGEDVVKVYDKVEGRQWDCGAGAVVAAAKAANSTEGGAAAGAAATDSRPAPAIVERVRVRDGYLVEGRADGYIGVWTC